MHDFTIFSRFALNNISQIRFHSYQGVFKAFVQVQHESIRILSNMECIRKFIKIISVFKKL